MGKLQILKKQTVTVQLVSSCAASSRHFVKWQLLQYCNTSGTELTSQNLRTKFVYALGFGSSTFLGAPGDIWCHE